MISTCLVTSGQIEAMCNARKPSLNNALRTTPQTSSPVQKSADRGVGARASCASAPMLNCEDVPEFMIRGLGRVGPREKPGKGPPATRKFRGKPLALPTLAEADDGLADHEYLFDSEASQGIWSCLACTFTNHAHLKACQICDAARFDLCGQIVESRNEQDLPPAVDASNHTDWPKLRVSLPNDYDSWIECDASSHASSWVDIGNVHELAMDGDEWEAAVLVSAVGEQNDTQRPMSWSERLKGGGIVQVTPLQKKPENLKSLCRAARVDRGTRPVECSDCTELDNLEDHRLCPSVSRGTTQRGKRTR